MIREMLREHACVNIDAASRSATDNYVDLFPRIGRHLGRRSIALDEDSYSETREQT
jgi:hypothetical protein